MGTIERDSNETAARLRAWLTEVEGFDGVEVSDVRIPTSTGWSNETILFDAAWSGEVHELVARIAPTDHQVFPTDTFSRQFHVMRALAERSDVPMARIHWLEQDTAWFGSPFWIMERVRGDIPADNPPYASAGWLAEASVDDQAKTWWSAVDALARVHNADLGTLAIPADALAPPADPVGAELAHYERFLDWAEDGRPHDAARRALAWLHEHRPPPPEPGPSLVWGDARFSNLIYRDFEVAAVLDWEMVTIGDPLLDLGWWLFADETLTVGSGGTRLPGFASVAETAARWEQATGRSAAALDYYLVFAGMRFSVIMLRIGQLLQGIGLVPPEFAYDNLVTDGLEQQMAKR